MNERKGQPKEPGAGNVSQGPVITISREHGCFASHIAKNLANVLTKKSAESGNNAQWNYLSKEIIEEAAKELKLSPEITKSVVEYEGRGFIDNISQFFSDEYYPSNSKVNNTIAKFVYNAATNGNVIIIGRASEAIVKDFEKSFHVKLVAPLEWRAKHLSDTFGMSIADAKKEVIEFDRRQIGRAHV